jgi:hypothetical protein
MLVTRSHESTYLPPPTPPISRRLGVVGNTYNDFPVDLINYSTDISQYSTPAFYFIPGTGIANVLSEQSVDRTEFSTD